MDMKYLLLSVEDKVATVTIHRPDKGNALAPEVLMEVESIFTELSKRQDVNVIVLTGGERFFSAGFDLTIIRKLEKVSNEEYTALFHRAYRAILFCDQPVICAVGGPAIAGGFDLTLMCDIRYASERAKFGQREIVLSLTPIMDPLWRIIGMGNAKEVALTGRIYDAHEALRMGYVTKGLSRGQADRIGHGHCERDGDLRSRLPEGDEATGEQDRQRGHGRCHEGTGVALPHLHRLRGQPSENRCSPGQTGCGSEKQVTEQAAL